MEKTIGKEITNPIERERFLKDNCDAAESKGYMKPYTPEELQGHKEKLANVSIEIAEVETEAKIAAAAYKGQLKPLKEQRAAMVQNIKSKAEYVTETCYRFTDQQSRTTGYYNKAGDLIETRPATADELQVTLFGAIREAKREQTAKTGTDNN